MRIIPLLLLWLLAINPLKAQRVNAEIDMHTFFDNSEGNDYYRSTVTYAGTRFTPKLDVSSDDGYHHIVGGYNFLYEFGESELSKGAIEVYYKFQKKNVRVLFGSFPRSLMHEEMPDYLICDSIRYFRPEITGFDFLYASDNGHVEVFCDWIQKRSATEREQFMAGLSSRYQIKKFQIGLEGHIYHYALEDGGHALGHSIHEVVTAHPYVGLLLLKQDWNLLADLRLGTLFQMDRNREDMNWHTPIGFIADADLRWRRFTLHETFYAGNRQQYFGREGWGLYYWGDAFTQSHWYNRTDVAYDIIHHKNVSLAARLAFNFTDKGMQWHQMLTLRCNLGVGLYNRR